MSWKIKKVQINNLDLYLKGLLYFFHKIFPYLHKHKYIIDGIDVQKVTVSSSIWIFQINFSDKPHDKQQSMPAGEN